MLRTTTLTKALVVVGIGVLAAVPFLPINDFWVFFVSVSLIQTILLASLNLTLGYAGLVSLGHNALYAVGGYATAYFTVSQGAPVVVGLASGIVFGVLAGLLLSVTAVRTRTIYFAIITLAFLFLTFETVSKWPALGGFRGIHGIPGLSWSGQPFSRDAYFWFALASFVVSMALLQQLSSSALGRTFVSIRENEDAAASLGINVSGTKALNLGVAGGLAGLAGALFAHLSGSMFPEAASFTAGIRLFVAIVVGGFGTFAGPIVGMAVISAVDRLTVTWVTAQPIILMGLLIGFLVVLRVGIVGAVLTSRLRSFFLSLPDVDEAFAARAAMPIEELIARPDEDRAPGPILRVEDLAKRFGGVQALDGVDLTVERGTIHGLIGPNGSGKSTFVNLVTGFMPHDRGRIEFDGHQVTRPRPHVMARQGLVRIFQRAETFGRLLVIQNVVMGLHLRADRNLVRCMLPLPARRRGERELAADAFAILQAVGLEHRALSPVSILPYGEQRLLEIARAVASAPRLLILDEPATGLTSVELDRLGTLLQRLREGGLTILIIEHNMEFLMDLADEVTVFDSGRRISRGKPSQVQIDPLVVEAYLGEPVAV